MKQLVVLNVLPHIERMIEKEEQHLCWLESKDAPKEIIENSKSFLNHLQQRYKEYVDFIILEGKKGCKHQEIYVDGSWYKCKDCGNYIY